MKRILSLLLTAALAAALLVSPAAAAESAPWIEANGVGTSSLTVSIRGLSGSYDSVQITLTLDYPPPRTGLCLPSRCARMGPPTPHTASTGTA